MDDSGISVESLQHDLLRLFNEWNTLGNDHPLAYLEIARAGPGQSPSAVIKQILHNLILRLEKEWASVLQRRFFDGLSAAQTAVGLSMAESTVFRKQREAIGHLAQLLYAEEELARAERLAHFYQRLEAPTYQQLFGADEQVDEILVTLESPASPWIVLLEGIGGIGKTSLADKIIRRAIQRRSFANFGWVTARRSLFRLDGSILPTSAPALSPEALLERLAEQLLEQPIASPYSLTRALAQLQAQTKAQPHLIVVDNLETLNDLDALLPTLRQLVNPTKILLTSRQSLDAEPSIHSTRTRPLAAADSLALVRHEAQSRNLPLLATADDETLAPIFTTVGGNPLALRLVVGQCRRHPLETVLEDLRQARGRTVEHLYTFLYRQVWDGLDESERQVLVAMPLTPEDGSGLGYLASVAEASETQVHDALERLVALNVVDYRGDFQRGRYTIHSLTRTFLLEQVIRWQREEGGG